MPKQIVVTTKSGGPVEKNSSDEAKVDYAEVSKMMIRTGVGSGTQTQGSEGLLFLRCAPRLRCLRLCCLLSFRCNKEKVAVLGCILSSALCFLGLDTFVSYILSLSSYARWVCAWSSLPSGNKLDRGWGSVFLCALA